MATTYLDASGGSPLAIMSEASKGPQSHHTTFGRQYRRAGDPMQQQTYYYPGGQSLTYGPNDDTTDYDDADPFLHQLLAVDMQRRVMVNVRPQNCMPYLDSVPHESSRPGTNGESAHQYSCDPVEQHNFQYKVGESDLYFQSPITRTVVARPPPMFSSVSSTCPTDPHQATRDTDISPTNPYASPTTSFLDQAFGMASPGNEDFRLDSMASPDAATGHGRNASNLNPTAVAFSSFGVPRRDSVVPQTGSNDDDKVATDVVVRRAIARL